MGTNNSVDPRTAEQIAESKRIADQRAAFRAEWEKQNPFVVDQSFASRPVGTQERTTYEQAVRDREAAFNAAWNAPGRAQSESMRAGRAYAAAAAPDKTDSYLRSVGIKRRTGSMQSSFIGRAFDPSAPIGRGNLLGD